MRNRNINFHSASGARTIISAKHDLRPQIMRPSSRRRVGNVTQRSMWPHACRKLDPGEPSSFGKLEF